MPISPCRAPLSVKYYYLLQLRILSLIVRFLSHFYQWFYYSAYSRLQQHELVLENVWRWGRLLHQDSSMAHQILYIYFEVLVQLCGTNGIHSWTNCAKLQASVNLVVFAFSIQHSSVGKRPLWYELILWKLEQGKTNLSRLKAPFKAPNQKSVVLKLTFGWWLAKYIN